MRTRLLIFPLFLCLNASLTHAQGAFFDSEFILANKKDVFRVRDSVEEMFALTWDDRKSGAPCAYESDSTILELFEDYLRFAAHVEAPYDNAPPDWNNLIKLYTTTRDTVLFFRRKCLCREKEMTSMTDSRGKEVAVRLSSYSLVKKRIDDNAQLVTTPPTQFLSSTGIIDGLALFLKKRIKEELGIAFLNRFAEKLDSNTLLRAVLPETHRLLRGIASMDQQIMSLNSLTINAFHNDLMKLPENLDNAFQTEPVFEPAREHPNYKYFALPFTLVKNAQLGSHPAVTIEDVQARYFKDTSHIARTVQLLVALESNLRDKVNTLDVNPLQGYWITPEAWKALQRRGGDTLFLARIFHGYRAAFPKEMTPRKAKQVMQQLSEDVPNVLFLLNSFDLNYRSMSRANPQSMNDSLAIDLAWSMLSLAQKLNQRYVRLFVPTTEKQESLWFIAESTLKVVSAAQREQYAALVLNTFQILRGLYTFKGEVSKEMRWVNEFFFYGSFITDVLTASDAQDVADILDRYAAPVGSFSVKRRAKFSVSVNAFPGIYTGLERPINSQQTTKDWNVSRTVGVSGVTAPVGLSFNWGNLGYRNRSFSLFASAIDIGAVLSYRWSGDDSQGLPQVVTWNQVLSPGLHAVYGFGNLPLGVSLGGQLTPKLRRVTEGGNVLGSRDFWRLYLGINADITIFNLFQTGRREHRDGQHHPRH